LHVELEIEFGPDCIFHGRDVETERVDLFLFDYTCNCSYSVPDENGDADESVYSLTEPVGDECVCRAFCEYGCVPTIEAIEDGRFVVSTHVPDRQVLTGLVDSLKRVSDRVRLLRIVEETGAGDDGRSVSFDLTTLTGTQRETLELAVTHGYYDDPKGISMGDLAEKLDISKSALSRRLSAAEATLVSELVRPD
jgi:predicted DNA binding protein